MLTVNKRLWFGAAAFALVLASALPNVALAATVKCPDYSGKVVKVKTDFWLVQGGQRWRLVDRDVAGTWDKTIVTPKTACVATVTALPEGGMLSFRAGTRLIKVAGSGTVYALGQNGVLHPISSPAIAAQWYGRYWTTTVRTISKETFAKFTVGEALTLDKINDGAVVRLSGKAQLYLVRDGKLVKITGPIRAAISSNARTLSAAVFKKLAVSAETITGAEILKISALNEQVSGTATTETKTEVKTEVKTEEVKVDTKTTTGVTEELTGANYKGPFPAPEGMVLEGYIGSAKYFEPTGSGIYQFVPKTDGARSINCLDSTRTVYKSKGKNYDAGFKEGIFYGIKDGDVLFPKYNDTPRGGNVGNQYYNEGFRVGYKHGYEVGNDYGVYYDCRTTAYKPGDYDADGWRKTTGFEKAKNLAAVYFPGEVGGYAGVGKTSADAYAWTLNTVTEGQRVQDTKLNKDKPLVNLSRVEVMESVPEGAETSMTMEAVAKMSYDAALQYTNTKYNRICTLTEPNTETRTYGSNTFTLLSFVQICKPEANQEATWKLQVYAFAKGKTSGHVFTTTFIDPFSIKKIGSDEFDMSKFPSNDFIAQFLTKLQFN